MNAQELKELQAPLKDLYRQNASAAVVVLRAEGLLGEHVSCKVTTGQKLVEAGLHAASGGSGMQACSGDMLLEALVACAGVTMQAVATNLDIAIEHGQVSAEADLDFRGTLGVDKQAAVGLQNIRLRFALQSSAKEEQLATLLRLTERYCVVLQTLRNGCSCSAEIELVEA